LIVWSRISIELRHGMTGVTRHEAIERCSFLARPVVIE
jgi:hypothetical protein